MYESSSVDMVAEGVDSRQILQDQFGIEFRGGQLCRQRFSYTVTRLLYELEQSPKSTYSEGYLKGLGLRIQSQDRDVLIRNDANSMQLARFCELLRSLSNGGKNSALIIDIETTGLPNRTGLAYGQYPSCEDIKAYDSARIVQLSFMLCGSNLEKVDIQDFIIRAEDFEISNAALHGITNEMSEAVGVPFEFVADILSKYLDQVTHLIAHNIDFDVHVLMSELCRIGKTDVLSKIRDKVQVCTMRGTRQIVKAASSFGRSQGRIKDPSLSELYRFVTGKPFKNEHDARRDVINLYIAVKNLYEFREGLLRLKDISSGNVENVSNGRLFSGHDSSESDHDEESRPRSSLPRKEKVSYSTSFPGNSLRKLSQFQ